MKALNKGIAGLLVVWTIGLHIPKLSFCAGASLFAKSEKTTITRHEIEILTTPEKNIPLAMPEKGEKKGTNKWLWLVLGAVAVGGAALALGGGGGDDPTPTKTDVSVSW